MQETVLFTYHNTTLYTNDPLTLRDGEWLSDAILSFYFDYLHHKILSNPHDALFLKPSVVQCLQFPADISQHELIFIPINSELLEHWSLLVYTKTPPMFHYFDSMANHNHTAAMRVKEKLRTLGPAEMITHSCPQQENSADCGVFVILFADLLARRYADAHNYHSGASVVGCPARGIMTGGSPAESRLPRTFWWIDYGDLCNPTRARAILRRLVRDYCARSSPFLIPPVSNLF